MVAPQCLQAGHGILLAAGGGMKEMSDSEKKQKNPGTDATGTGRNYGPGMAILGNAKTPANQAGFLLCRACALELRSG
jgi:hypothetical protein